MKCTTFVERLFNKQEMKAKEKIIAEVFKLLLRKGYDGVSISDIQQQTGLSRGLLYHYFGNKDQLFIESTTKYCLALFDLDFESTRTFDIKQMIEYTVERFWKITIETLKRFTSKDENITILDYDFLFYRVMRASEAFTIKYNQLRERERNAWRQVIANSIQRGDIKAGIDIDKCANTFLYLSDGIWMNAVHENRSDSMVDTFRTTLTDYYNLLR